MSSMPNQTDGRSSCCCSARWRLRPPPSAFTRRSPIAWRSGGHEIAVRLAVGASRRDVLVMVLGEGARCCGARDRYRSRGGDPGRMVGAIDDLRPRKSRSLVIALTASLVLAV